MNCLFEQWFQIKLTLPFSESKIRPQVLIIWQRHSRSSAASLVVPMRCFFFSSNCWQQRCKMASCRISNFPSSPINCNRNSPVNYMLHIYGNKYSQSRPQMAPRELVIFQKVWQGPLVNHKKWKTWGPCNSEVIIGTSKCQWTHWIFTLMLPSILRLANCRRSSSSGDNAPSWFSNAS